MRKSILKKRKGEGGKINLSDNKTKQYNFSPTARTITDIVREATKNGVDPYAALAISLQETGIGSQNPNVLYHQNPVYFDKNMAGVEGVKNIKKLFSNTQKLQQKGKIPYGDEFMYQGYNGFAKVWPDSKGFMKDLGSEGHKIYGKTIPEEGIDFKKTPLYGQRIKYLQDNVLKNNPAVNNIVDQYSYKWNPNPPKTPLLQNGGHSYEDSLKLYNNTQQLLPQYLKGDYSVLDSAIYPDNYFSIRPRGYYYNSPSATKKYWHPDEVDNDVMDEMLPDYVKPFQIKPVTNRFKAEKIIIEPSKPDLLKSKDVEQKLELNPYKKGSYFTDLDSGDIYDKKTGKLLKKFPNGGYTWANQETARRYQVERERKEADDKQFVLDFFRKEEEEAKRYKPSDAVKQTKAALAMGQLASPLNPWIKAIATGGDLATAIRYGLDGQHAKMAEDLTQAGVNWIPSSGALKASWKSSIIPFLQGASDAKTIAEGQDLDKKANGGLLTPKINQNSDDIIGWYPQIDKSGWPKFITPRMEDEDIRRDLLANDGKLYDEQAEKVWQQVPFWAGRSKEHKDDYLEADRAEWNALTSDQQSQWIDKHNNELDMKKNGGKHWIQKAVNPKHKGWEIVEDDLPEAGEGDKIKLESKPTTQDSLDLYNNTQELLKYYGNKEQYTDKGAQYSQGEKGFVHSMNDYKAGEMNALLKANLPPVTSRSVGKWNQIRLLPKAIFMPSSLKPLEGEVDYQMKPEEFHRDIDANKYQQRERVNSILDLDAPMASYDRRITPRADYHFVNTSPSDRLKGNDVSFFGYDPIAIKPEAMKTPEDRRILEQRYGKKPEEVIKQDNGLMNMGAKPAGFNPGFVRTPQPQVQPQMQMKKTLTEMPKPVTQKQVSQYTKMVNGVRVPITQEEYDSIAKGQAPKPTGFRLEDKTIKVVPKKKFGGKVLSWNIIED